MTREEYDQLIEHELYEEAEEYVEQLEAKLKRYENPVAEFTATTTEAPDGSIWLNIDTGMAIGYGSYSVIVLPEGEKQ